MIFVSEDFDQVITYHLRTKHHPRTMALSHRRRRARENALEKASFGLLLWIS